MQSAKDKMQDMTDDDSSHTKEVREKLRQSDNKQSDNRQSDNKQSDNKQSTKNVDTKAS